MFQASEFRQTIGSKSTLVPSDHQLDYTDGDTIRFEIPKFIGFIDPRQSFLSMKIQINSPAVRAHFSNSAQSLINNLRIWDLESTVQMENVENYAELINLFNHYDSNQSLSHKRQLLEGAVDSAYTLAQSNWFAQYASGATVNASTSVVGNEVQVCLPLHSGILGGDKIFPFALTGGRIELDTNAAKKVLQAYPQGTTAPALNGVAYNYHAALPAAATVISATGASTMTGTGNAAWNATVANFYAGWKIETAGSQIAYVLSNTAANPPVLTITPWGGTPPAVGVATTVTPTPNTVVLGTTALAGHTHIANTSQNPFMVGQELQISYQPTGGGAARSKTVPLATAAGANLKIVSIEANTITFDGDWVIPTDALNNTLLINAVSVGVIPAFVNAGAVSYTMRDIELVLKQVSPPAQYVNQLVKGGTELDIYTYDIYRNNVQATDTVAQQNIPAYNTRAKCILSLPMANRSHSMLRNDLLPILDQLQFYNYYIEGLSQPNKKVPTGILNSGYNEPIQLWELIKALGSANVKVKNLKDAKGYFALGRSLGMYGGVHNLRDVGDLSLRTEYTGTTAPTTNKLFLNYISHIRRLVITEGEKKVIL